MGTVKRLYNWIVGQKYEYKPLTQADILLLIIGLKSSKSERLMSGPYTLNLAVFHFCHKYTLLSENPHPFEFSSSNRGPSIENLESLLERMSDDKLVEKKDVGAEREHVPEQDSNLYELQARGKSQLNNLVSDIDDTVEKQARHSRTDSVLRPGSIVVEVNTMSPEMFNEPLIRTN